MARQCVNDLSVRLATERRREVDLAPHRLAQELRTLVQFRGQIEHVHLVAQNH